MEDISSQIDDIESNPSDGDENDTDTDVKKDEGGSLIVQAPVRPVPRQPSASGSLLENSRCSSVSGQPSEPKFSRSDSSQGQPRVPGRLAQAVIPGQPGVSPSKVNIQWSPLFTYNYFEKVSLEQARCLVCFKTVQRKQGSTAGMKTHLASHKEQYAAFEKIQERVVELRKELSASRNKKDQPEVGAQSKLFRYRNT